MSHFSDRKFNIIGSLTNEIVGLSFVDVSNALFPVFYLPILTTEFNCSHRIQILLLMSKDSSESALT